ncbi:DUF2062 domain-containing protein [Rubritalea marina]|uniref:DUF2062 domain-containing protein n=1 Tax=Rubritalea marina TaxID=361055 RepID=UPI00037D5878|nr:DUF2062 domain-containing protein [Rubritalea marina]
MKLRYLRFVRKSYRYLRHPRLRRIKWLEPLTHAIFDKQFWKPCRDTVASGLSVGLFCAMLPVPMQMILAAIGCIRTKGNIPVALATCWITNPITQLPIMVTQHQFGAWLHKTIGIPRPPIISNLEKKVTAEDLYLFGVQILEAGEFTVNVGDFVLGFFSAAVLLSLIAFPIVWGVCLFLPNLGKHPDRMNKQPNQEQS